MLLEFSFSEIWYFHFFCVILLLGPQFWIEFFFTRTNYMTIIFSFVIFRHSTADMGKLISSIRCKLSLLWASYHCVILRNKNKHSLVVSRQSSISRENIDILYVQELVWRYTSLSTGKFSCVHLTYVNQIGNHTIVCESQLRDKNIALLQSVLWTVRLLCVACVRKLATITVKLFMTTWLLDL